MYLLLDQYNPNTSMLLTAEQRIKEISELQMDIIFTGLIKTDSVIRLFQDDDYDSDTYHY